MTATHNRTRRWTAAAGALALVLVGAVSFPAQALARQPAQSCTDTSIPVSIAPGQPASERIWGRLCTPSGHRVHSVQLLLHGLSYSHYYWDPTGLDPYRYSYVHDARLAGLATFDIDRIGVGRSSHPVSAAVTLESNAYTVHQVVTALHRQVAGQRFASVTLVGHSYGSEIAELEASDFADVNGLILTGFAHHQSVTASLRTSMLAEPASADPRLAAEVPPGDPGYLTLQDAFRPELMYNLADADPSVVAADIAHKETLTAAEVATLQDGLLPTVTARLRIPVLIIDGTKDQLICASDATDCSSSASLAAAEQPFYPMSRISTYVVPGSGHAIDLHLNGYLAFIRMICWSVRLGAQH